MNVTGTIQPAAAGEIERLAEKFVKLFPRLEPESARVALHLYRLLAQGEPVAPRALAEAAGLPEERVNGMLAVWRGVYYEGEAIIGFWGLTPRPFSKHLFKVDGRKLYTWCAWDTLFIPQILGRTAEVESPCPVTGEVIRLSISPERVESCEPAEAVVSMMEPPEDIAEDIVAKFCHYVYFFRSPEAGAQWCADNPGATLMSIEAAHALGRRKNLLRFKDALAE